MKEIHFYLDVNYMHVKDCYYAYDETEDAINNKEDIIHTTSLANITFDLLDLGYRIFLHRNGKTLECKPGMDGTEKEVRREHHILRMIMGHVFDEYFYDNATEFDLDCRMLLSDFKDCCKFGAITNSDGYGYYGTKDKISKIYANPSDFVKDQNQEDFNYVYWYNK